MQFFNKFTGTALALALTASLGAVSQAEASHGRGAAIVPSVDANGTLTVDMVGFWRQQGTNVCSFPHDCINATVTCLLYTSPSPRDQRGSRMPSSA